MLSRRKLIAGKIESVEGTAEAITAADTGIIALEAKFDADFKTYDRSNAVTGTLSKPQPIPGQQMGTISFKVELKGAGAAYSASIKPALSPYLRACGFAETVTTTAGSEKVTYLPASTGIPSMTIWFYQDGMVYKLKGCRGTVSFSGKIGEPAFADFKFTGVYDGAPAASMLVPTLEATVPPILLNTTLTIDSFNAVAESFSIDMGNQVDLRSDINSAAGYKSAVMNDRKPTGKLDPEMVLPSDYDFMTKWQQGTAAALTIGPVGTGNYNKYTITAPKATYTKVGTGDRTGLVTADLDFALSMNTGDDEVKIEFTK